MGVTQRFSVDTVQAARAGNQRALDDLVAECLPLVYNIVGRALAGQADVDDVVQETLLRVVRDLPKLHSTDRFRSWLVAITVHQIRDGWRIRGTRPVPTNAEALADVADPGADFVDLTILRLGLEGQRREVVEATRWLDPDDRELLSLWWLEAAGELARAEIAHALGLSSAHATVRVQRMLAQLDTSRAVVRVLAADPRCPQLTHTTATWDGSPGALWRKRIARHTRECRSCNGAWSALVPPDRLLVGMALVPVPSGLASAALGGGTTTGTTTSAGATAGTQTAPVGGIGRAVHLVTGKPIAAVLVGAIAVTSAVMIGHAALTRPRHDRAWPAAVVAQQATSSPTASAGVAPVASPSTTASPSPSAKTSPSVKRPNYGSTVDTVDTAGAKLQKPGALPRRPTGTLTAVEGNYQNAQPGFIGGTYVMMHRDDHVTLSGRGYIQVRYEIAWFNRPGGMVMPTWTGLQGKLFHVASGGLRRMDDTKPGLDPAYTWMGQPTVGSSGPASGYVVLPSGAQQMWQNEFFYLDGTVTLTNHERGADYNITATPKTWEQVTADINTPPPADPASKGWVRYGIVRDTGDDGAPVPQYTTRTVTADPATVPQQSAVR